MGKFVGQPLNPLFFIEAPLNFFQKLQELLDIVICFLSADAFPHLAEKNADEIRIGQDGKPEFQSNNAGGILGGISTGQDIITRVGFKPTSSILTPVRTIDKHGNETELITKGRHDPCVGIRGVPIVEAMMACVLADHWLRHKAQCL